MSRKTLAAMAAFTTIVLSGCASTAPASQSHQEFASSIPEVQVLLGDPRVHPLYRELKDAGKSDEAALPELRAAHKASNEYKRYKGWRVRCLFGPSKDVTCIGDTSATTPDGKGNTLLLVRWKKSRPEFVVGKQPVLPS